MFLLLAGRHVLMASRLVGKVLTARLAAPECPRAQHATGNVIPSSHINSLQHRCGSAAGMHPWNIQNSTVHFGRFLGANGWWAISQCTALPGKAGFRCVDPGVESLKPQHGMRKSFFSTSLVALMQKTKQGNMYSFQVCCFCEGLGIAQPKVDQASRTSPSCSVLFAHVCRSRLSILLCQQ